MQVSQMFQVTIALLTGIVALDNLLAQIPWIKSNSTAQFMFHFFSGGLKGVLAVQKVVDPSAAQAQATQAPPHA